MPVPTRLKATVIFRDLRERALFEQHASATGQSLNDVLREGWQYEGNFIRFLRRRYGRRVAGLFADDRRRRDCER